jgi:hypothetical protein
MRNRRKPFKGRPTRFETESYEKGGQLSDFLDGSKLGFRRIFIRHRRLDVCFAGSIPLASFLLIWEECDFALKTTPRLKEKVMMHHFIDEIPLLLSPD